MCQFVWNFKLCICRVYRAQRFAAIFAFLQRFAAIFAFLQRSAAIFANLPICSDFQSFKLIYRGFTAEIGSYRSFQDSGTFLAFQLAPFKGEEPNRRGYDLDGYEDWAPLNQT